MWRSPHGIFSGTIVFNACSSSTGMSTMATGPSTVFMTILRSCFSVHTNTRITLEPVMPLSGGSARLKERPSIFPFSAGEGDQEYRDLFHRVLVPAADAFKPDIVIISAGFDAHQDDPLASMGLTENGYAELTAIVGGIAAKHCQNRILSCLEGGYNLTALAASVESHLLTLLKV